MFLLNSQRILAFIPPLIEVGYSASNLIKISLCNKICSQELITESDMFFMLVNDRVSLFKN